MAEHRLIKKEWEEHVDIETKFLAYDLPPDGPSRYGSLDIASRANDENLGNVCFGFTVHQL
jgi:hypothetical protein